METHELKLSAKYFKDIKERIKTFELRKNDRNFQAGDTLILKEYYQGDTDYENGIYTPPHYTNNQVTREVTYMLEGGKYGLEKGYVILGIE